MLKYEKLTEGTVINGEKDEITFTGIEMTSNVSSEKIDDGKGDKFVYFNTK